MTKADIVREVSDKTGLTKVEVEAAFDGFIVCISNALKKGERVDIRGFGSFVVKKRNARDSRNPATNEVFKLDARYVPTFKVSKILKEYVNSTLID